MRPVRLEIIKGNGIRSMIPCVPRWRGRYQRGELKLAVYNLTAQVEIMPIIAISLILVFSVLDVSASGLEEPFILGSGARSLGMARASVAASEDPTAIFWNPAGLVKAKRQGINLFHTNLFLDSSYDFIGYTLPFPHSGVISLAACRLSVSDIEQRDKRNNLLGGFKDSQSRYILAYSRDLTPYLSAGLSLKMATHKLGRYSGTGLGADLGLLYQPLKNLQGLRLGLNLQNILEPVIKLKTDETILPFNLKTGACFSFNCSQILADRLTLAMDMDRSGGTKPRYHTGLEYTLFNLLSLRAGVDDEDWTCGLGLSYKGIALDYALSMQDIGANHKFSMSLQFGPTMDEIKQKLRQQAEAEVNRLLELELSRREELQITELINKGNQHLKNKEYKEAAFQFKMALTLKPEDKEINNLLQSSEEQIRETELKQSLISPPSFEQEYISPAKPKVKPEQIEKKPLKQKAEVYLEDGISDYEAKRYKDAVSKFNQALLYNRKLSQAKEYLQKANKELLKEKKKVVEKDRTLLLRISQTYDRGLSYFKQGKLSKAIESWELVYQELPGYEQVEANLIKGYLFAGLNLYNAGDLEGSINSWEKALRIDPQNIKALRYIERTKIEAEKIGQIRLKGRAVEQ